jgi:hypothetical protein
MVAGMSEPRGERRLHVGPRPVSSGHRSATPAVVLLAGLLVIALVGVLGSATGGTATASPEGLGGTPAGATDRPILVDRRSQVESRHPDGVPAAMGTVPVLRPADAGLLLATSVDDRPVLVGGWYAPQPRPCPQPGAEARHRLLPGCQLHLVAGSPGSTEGLAVIPPRGGIQPGPVVLQVHVNSGDAATCAAEDRTRCARAVVVDEVVWAGDRTTFATPFRIDHIVAAIRSEIPDLQVVPLAAPGEGCADGLPDQAWMAHPWTRGVGRVLIYPSVGSRLEARGLVLDPAGATPASGEPGACDDPQVTPGSGSDARWIVLDNVMVEVAGQVLPSDGGRDDHAALADRIEAALLRLRWAATPP